MDRAEQDRVLRWAEALTTRLCHDVAGLAGTLGGTLEMALGVTPDTSNAAAPDPEAAGLAVETARQLAARVRLFRAAWGGGDLEADTLTALAEGLPNRPRLRLDLAAADAAVTDGTLAPGGPRLILCLLLAACAGLPHGGTLSAHALPDGGFCVTMAGRHAAWPQPLPGAAALEVSPDGEGAIDPRDLATPIAMLVAAAGHWRLRAAALTVTALPGPF